MKLIMGAELKAKREKQRSESAVKDVSSYEWFAYTGRPYSVTTVNGKKTANFVPGYKFGLRSSSNGKNTRMITAEFGPTIVFTISEEALAKIKRASSPARTPKA